MRRPTATPRSSASPAPPTGRSLPVGDLVIEAATENEELKVKILKEPLRHAVAAHAARDQYLVDLDYQARSRN